MPSLCTGNGASASREPEDHEAACQDTDHDWWLVREKGANGGRLCFFKVYRDFTRKLKMHVGDTSILHHYFVS
jgi:hypothetical protein